MYCQYCVCEQTNTLNEQDWERLAQQTVVASVQQAFGARVDDDGMYTEDEDEETGYASLNTISDPRSLALALQQQLDVINNEIRLLVFLIIGVALNFLLILKYYWSYFRYCS